MGLTADRIAEAVSALGKLDPRFAEAAGRHGLPEPRIREPGYETLLRAIVSQQVSTAAAASIWRKLEAQVGDLHDPARMLLASPEELRAAGLSRMKASYVHSLAGHVLDGSLPLDALPVGTLFAGNNIEVDILATHLRASGLTPADAWQACREKFEAGAWAPEMSTVKGPLTPASVACRP